VFEKVVLGDNLVMGTRITEIGGSGQQFHQSLGCKKLIGQFLQEQRSVKEGMMFFFSATFSPPPCLSNTPMFPSSPCVFESMRDFADADMISMRPEAGEQIMGSRQN